MKIIAPTASFGSSPRRNRRSSVPVEVRASMVILRDGSVREPWVAARFGGGGCGSGRRHGMRTGREHDLLGSAVPAHASHLVERRDGGDHCGSGGGDRF